MSRGEPQQSHAPLMVLRSAATLHKSPFHNAFTCCRQIKQQQGTLTRDTDSSVTQTGHMGVCLFFGYCSANKSNCGTSRLCACESSNLQVKMNTLFQKCGILLLMSKEVTSACVESLCSVVKVKACNSGILVLSQREN